MQKLIDNFERKPNLLVDVEIEKIVNSLNKFSIKILKSKNFLNNKYRGYGLPFIAEWCSKNNLEKILNGSFGSLDTLNKFSSKKKGIKFQVLPRGLVVHWIAGNVPTLGFLSLILGIITKNKNIVRLPSFSKNILIDLLKELKKIDSIANKITKNILILRYDKQDIKISQKLSMIADSKIIWGSDEVCKTLKDLPTKLDCDNLIFSNKISFIIVDKEALRKNTSLLIKKISRDILIFDQKACASPHTIFLQNATQKQIFSFAKNLSKNLKKTYRNYQFSPTTNQKKIKILNLRLKYSLKHKVFSDYDDLNSTVLYDNKSIIGPAIENGTIFVRKLPKLNLLKKNFPNNIQTLGITKISKNLEPYINELQKIGLARIKMVGQMTNFESTWDGLNIPLKLIKYSTLPNTKT